MAERKITARNVSIILHVARTPIMGDEGAVRSTERAETDANSLAHAIMLTLAREGYKIPDMTCEVTK